MDMKAFIIMLCTLRRAFVFVFWYSHDTNKKPSFSIGNILQLVLQISLTIYFVLILKIGVVGVFYGILGEIKELFFFL